MSDDKSRPEPAPSEEMTRFQKLARALFGVDRQDVEKHEPVKRTHKDRSGTVADHQ